MTMNTAHSEEIIIVGAGVVGLACAWHLLERGHGVTVLDRGEPGRGASFGNAGTIAPYGVIPIAQPGLWRDIPMLLFSRDSPFRIRWTRMPRLFPWLLRFLREAGPRRFQHNAELLSKLLAGTSDAWEPLLADSGAKELTVANGALYFYRSAAAWRRAQAAIRQRDELGVEQQVLDTAAIRELEPTLADHAAGGILFPGACHIRDPHMLVRRLADAVIRRGGRIECRTVVGVAPQGARVTVTTEQGDLRAERVVIAAGAWSSPLAAGTGDRVPLETERGYHIEFPMETMPLQRPCCPADWAFYMTPMAGRLRVAGTVELGRRDDPPNTQRFDYIRHRVERLLGPLGKPSSHWLGCRPSLPDSIPVIGPSPRDPRVIHAFGHGHLGVTLAARTGQLVADCIDGYAPDWLRHCSAGRF
jgi:D-amino-acid dehydrogenase